MTTLQRMIKYCAMAFAIFLTVSIFSGIFGALGMLTSAGRDVTGPMQTYPVSSHVENLDMEISAASMQIVTGDRFQVESNHKYLTVAETNGTLKITEKKVAFGVSNEGVSVILTVPEGFIFDEASIAAGAGKVDIASLCANTLKMELGAGKTDIGYLMAQRRSSISTGAGKLTIRDCQLHNLDMELGVGKQELTGRLTGKCDIEYGIGNADITLLGSQEDYRIQMEKGLGSATLDGRAMSDDRIYGDGENRIEIEGGIGSMDIRFQAR